MASGPFDKTEPRVAATKTDRSDGNPSTSSPRSMLEDIRVDEGLRSDLPSHTRLRRERERVPGEWGLGGWMKEGGALLPFFTDTDTATHSLLHGLTLTSQYINPVSLLLVFMVLRKNDAFEEEEQKSEFFKPK